MIPNSPPPPPTPPPLTPSSSSSEGEEGRRNVVNGVKRRRRLLPQETAFLMEIFERTPRPSPQIREWISSKLGHLLSMRAIQIWFQNRRAKVRREFQELHSSPLADVDGAGTVSSSSDFDGCLDGVGVGSVEHQQQYQQQYQQQHPQQKQQKQRNDDPFLLEVPSIKDSLQPIRIREVTTTTTTTTTNPLTSNELIFDWSLMEEDFFL